ncbi:hypothetical protein [Streptomyces sp. NPDC057253]|uniref:hypothetical protein n=1 Tax=Streptomyces sp. NPDC057253 TaxID=3346069 RepID=UPI00363805D4
MSDALKARAARELMRLCCVQLFNTGVIDDVLLIWIAKTASMDAACSIDVQLLCGQGLAETKAYLSLLRTPEAKAAQQRLLESEEAGDFEGFRVEEYSAQYADYHERDSWSRSDLPRLGCLVCCRYRSHPLAECPRPQPAQHRLPRLGESPRPARGHRAGLHRRPHRRLDEHKALWA